MCSCVATLGYGKKPCLIEYCFAAMGTKGRC